MKSSADRLVIVEAAVVGPLATNAYLVCEGPDCILVDPGADAEVLLGMLKGRRLLAVIASHGHFDHVGAAGEVIEATGAPFYMSREDYEAYRELNKPADDWGFEAPDIPPAEEPPAEPLPGLEVVETPGHTPGSISLLGPGFVITGDLLFKGSVGRTDLPGGSWRDLAASICGLYELPGNYIVYPGHGAATTIGAEAALNPFVNRSTCPRRRPSGAAAGARRR